MIVCSNTSGLILPLSFIFTLHSETLIYIPLHTLSEFKLIQMYPSTPSVCFRGLGNMASKVVYLSTKPSHAKPQQRPYRFTHGILKPDEITKKNLRFLTEKGFFERGTTFFVVGDHECETTLKKLVGNDFEVANERDMGDVYTDLYIDFTYKAAPFVARIRKMNPTAPIIVQSNNHGSGTLWVPPLREAKPGNVFRAADCSLSGAIPVLAILRSFFETLFLDFITDRNVGKAPGSRFNNAFYFSDSFPPRKSAEFSSLTGIPTLATFKSSEVINPFYMVTFAATLDIEAIEEIFGSKTKFDQIGFKPLFKEKPKIYVACDDNTERFVLPPEPPTIREFAMNYPDVAGVPFIVYFSRTFIRRNGKMASFKIGFDVNLSAAIGNLDLMEAVAATIHPTLYGPEAVAFG